MTTAPGRGRLITTLAAAVAAMSVAGPLLRFATAPASVIALWRMVFTTALTAGLLATSSARPRPPGLPAKTSPRAALLTLLAGGLLAAHFVTWIASLRLTSIAASVTLVNTQPLFAAFLAAIALRERVSRRQLTGILVAIAGACGILYDGGLEGARLQGNLLALAGAATAAGYWVVGRALRPSVGLLAYVTRVYAAAAAALLAWCVTQGDRLLAHPATDWLIFAVLALGPGLGGHTLLNWSLRWLPAPVANVATLGEPVGATLLAALWLGETPATGTLLGGVVTLAGIAITVSARPGPPPSRKKPSHEPPLASAR